MNRFRLRLKETFVIYKSTNFRQEIKYLSSLKSLLNKPES